MAATKIKTQGIHGGGESFTGMCLLAVAAAGNPRERSARQAESSELICSVPLGGGEQRGSVSTLYVCPARTGSEGGAGESPKTETYMPPTFPPPLRLGLRWQG